MIQTVQKTSFPNYYFHVKFSEVKKEKFQQATMLFWRTTGEFYAAKRLEVLFPRRKDRYCWKSFECFHWTVFFI